MLLDKGAALWVGQIIAHNDSDSRLFEAQFLGQLNDAQDGTLRVGCTEVANDWNIVFQAVCKDGAKFQFQQRLVASVWIGSANQVLVCQCSFSQIFKHQGRGATTGNECLDHRQGCIHTIARKTCTASHRQCLHPKSRSIEDSPVILRALNWFVKLN